LESDLNYLLNFSEDMKEGITAFAEKRKPKFMGR
jgi:enoyl-CoA hydratase/carnithine racemase